MRQEIEDVIGLDTSGMLAVSAKKGTGVPEILEKIIKGIPPPEGDPDAPTKALIFDSWYDNYAGVVVLARVLDGAIRSGQRVTFMATGNSYEVQKVGVFSPIRRSCRSLGTGEVGFVIANIKEVKETKVGDTITRHAPPHRRAAPGIQGSQADGVRGRLPARLRPICTAADGDRQASAE